MSWSIGENRNRLLNLKSKFGLYQIVLTTPRTSPEKIALTVVEIQRLPDIEKTDSKEEFPCLKWTIYNSRRKVCVNSKTDTDKLSVAVYNKQNSLYLKVIEVALRFGD